MRKLGVLWVVVMFGSIAGCSLSGESEDRRLGKSDYVIFESTSSTTTTTTIAPPLPIDGTIIYMIRNKGLVARVRFVVQGSDLFTVLGMLSKPAPPSEVALGLSSGLSNRSDILVSATVIDGKAILDLGTDFQDIPGDDQILILGQLVLTSFAYAQITSIEFTQSDNPLSVFGPNGQAINRPVVRSDFSVLSSR